MIIPPLPARSVALSVLIGSPGASLPVRDLLATGEMCDIAPQTMRVALSRLVAAAELTTADGMYTLSPQHRERALRQEADIAPRRRPWSGQWETVIVVESGREASDRAQLRTKLAAARLAELREGVWMRPDNLLRPGFDDPHTMTLLAEAVDPDRVLHRLWNLGEWAARGHALLDASVGPALNGERFAAVAALVRHLRTDPALPPELLPKGWPTDAMRAAYDEYRAQLRAQHHDREGVLR